MLKLHLNNQVLLRVMVPDGIMISAENDKKNGSLMWSVFLIKNIVIYSKRTLDIILHLWYDRKCTIVVW